MPMSFEYEVNGFVFGMTVGLGWEDGVVITSRVNITRPGFHEALQRAVNVYPDARLAAILRERVLMYKSYPDGDMVRDLRNAPNDYLDEMLEGFAAMNRQDVLEVTEDDHRFVAAIKLEKSKRLEHERMKAYEPKQKLTGGAGYVYLVQSPTGYYKIGRTVNPRNRLKTFGVLLPFEVEFVAVISTPDMRELEKELHERFAMKRANGEWFALDQHDIEYIKGLAS